MCKKKLDFFFFADRSSLCLKTGQDGIRSYNELCGIGQLDLESVFMFAWKWWFCTAMLCSDSSPLPFMIIKLQSLSQGRALPHSYSCAIFCWHHWELPAIWWKQTFTLFWLATPHSNDSAFLSEFNCRTVRNCPTWWYIKVSVAHWGVSPPLRAIVYVINKVLTPLFCGMVETLSEVSFISLWSRPLTGSAWGTRWRGPRALDPGPADNVPFAEGVGGFFVRSTKDPGGSWWSGLCGF